MRVGRERIVSLPAEGPTNGQNGHPDATTPRGRLWIGVTGNIACGKSLVSATLAEVGAETIDADAVYASLVTPRAPLLERLVQRFGVGIVDATGGLDRRTLAGIVFSDPSALADLDGIVRPPVVSEILRLAEAATGPVVAIDAVKLIESGLADRCDEVWVVTCDPETQLARLMARNRLDRESAAGRIAAQSSVADKLARADRVIDNDGSPEETRRLVEIAFRAAVNEHTRQGADHRAPKSGRRKG